MDDEDDDPIPDDECSDRIQAWVLVFFLNLPVPLLLASEVCNSLHSIGGLIIGIVVCGVVTFYLVHKYRLIGISLCYGGACLALLQFLPILQIAAGLIAMESWRQMSGVRASNLGDDPATQFLGAIAVTIQTGQLLLMAALIAGSILQLIFRTSE